jgi:queuine tRNA-ribosyltransferase
MRFERLATDGRARLGCLALGHGQIDTPAFMPVGTYGAVKALDPTDVATTGTQMILGNTLHLALRPGLEVIGRMGGLHAFMGWRGPILTDSGGFQVMSLAHRRSIDDDGVTFQAPVDGRRFRLTPERAVGIQQELGSDIAMVLDQCPSYLAPREEIETAMRRSQLWAERCRRAYGDGPGALFGIVQGGVDPDLRRRSFEALASLGFEGYAVGGLAIGESAPTREAVLDALIPLLPEDRPRYLMGVGKPADLVAAVCRGIDLFDCVLPTRNGRNAHLFTATGVVRLRNSRYRFDESPIEPDCPCPACRHHSRAYLHHLDRIGDPLSLRLLTLHNLTYYQRLLARLREAIRTRCLGECAADFERQQRSGPAVR